jgi:phage internal scaffolding protein
MARFAKTKMITHLNNAVAQWGVDVSNVPQYQDALEIVRQAESSFGQLSANVRDRFGNDPSKFMAFVHDPKNADELRAMGLRDPLSPAPAPIKVEITNEPPRGGEADKAPKKAS